MEETIGGMVWIYCLQSAVIFPSLSKSDKKSGTTCILSSQDEIPKLSINELSLMAEEVRKYDYSLF